jgi:hypothetical protein
VKQKLIDKLMEKIRDLEPEESLELVGLDFLAVIDDAIMERLEKMSEDQLLTLI